jgi:hypothetical protein
LNLTTRLHPYLLLKISAIDKVLKMELEILSIAQKPNKEGQHLTVIKETVLSRTITNNDLCG